MELIEMYANQLAQAYLNQAGDQKIYEMAIGMFDRVLNLKRERLSELAERAVYSVEKNGGDDNTEVYTIRLSREDYERLLA